jgi:hypothetical protein
LGRFRYRVPAMRVPAPSGMRTALRPNREPRDHRADSQPSVFRTTTARIGRPPRLCGPRSLRHDGWRRGGDADHTDCGDRRGIARPLAVSAPPKCGREALPPGIGGERAA